MRILLLSFALLVVVSTQTIINTWPWTKATTAAWNKINHGGENEALDAVEAGCTACEELQCDGTVGFGGSPDENGETTLDAMLMDGSTFNVGAVGCLRRIKNAVGVARKVLNNTRETLLAGDLATKFAVEMGFKEESLSTPKSVEIWKKWKARSCQPNFWMNVSPNHTLSCGPYRPISDAFDTFHHENPDIARGNHDTISMLALSKDKKHIAAGTSTNGANHKIAGRVGDGPIMGAASYADSDVGGCGATGDGDLMMRFLPCYQAVEFMRSGMNPTQAATAALRRIAAKFPNFVGALVTMNKEGAVGAAGHGWKFSYSYQDQNSEGPKVVEVPPFN